MSIELEVGLENAANVKRDTEELFLEPKPTGLKNPKTQRVGSPGTELEFAL